MKIHHLRNASFILEFKQNFILVDPMLGREGTEPPFTVFRHKPQKNPIVPFPEASRPLLTKVNHCLITHQHPDHLDKEGTKLLQLQRTPITCSMLDEEDLRKKGLNIQVSVNYWERKEWLDGHITGIPALHGYGFIAKPMGNVMGFYLELPNMPTVYISADTVYTGDVEKVLNEQKPDISILACGCAQLDIGQPLLMTMEDIIKYIKRSEGKIVANHMEALNHCPTTRRQLKERLKKEDLLEKVLIPEDGESIDMKKELYPI